MWNWHFIISPILKSLHWLPGHYQISLKVLIIICKAHNSLAPQCISDTLTDCSPIRPVRSLYSGLPIVPIRSRSDEEAFTLALLFGTACWPGICHNYFIMYLKVNFFEFFLNLWSVAVSVCVCVGLCSFCLWAVYGVFLCVFVGGFSSYFFFFLLLLWLLCLYLISSFIHVTYCYCYVKPIVMKCAIWIKMPCLDHFGYLG